MVQNKKLDLKVLLKRVFHTWQKEFALAFEPRPLLGWIAEIAAERSPGRKRQPTTLSCRITHAHAFSSVRPAMPFVAACVYVSSWRPE
jgi:hypothetical protein